MLVQEDGTNLMETNTLVGSIRQASFDDIPAARVTRSYAEFAAMGYQSSNRRPRPQAPGAPKVKPNR